LPPITKLPNASMTWAGSVGAPHARRDRISRVEARLSESRSMVEISRMCRERREFQRRLDEQRSHQDQDRQRDRDRQEEIEHDRGQRQDQHHQNGEDAERQREIAALEDSADVAETRKSGPRCPCTLTRRDIDHGCCFPRACRSRAPNVCAAADGPPFRK